jgi:hypothetical protein
MTAKLIDGLALSKTLRAEVATRAAALTARGHQPGLAVVLVGDNPASEVYVRNKVKACNDNGLGSSFDRYPADLPEADLLARIDELNRESTAFWCNCRCRRISTATRSSRRSPRKRMSMVFTLPMPAR